MTSFAGCWSPNGKRVAYVSGPDATRLMTTSFMQDLLSRNHLYTMNADGSEKRCIVAGKGYYEDEPEWSGDGKTISFVRYQILRDGSEKKARWCVRPDGTGLKFVSALKDKDD
jgi:Tol biopolymer transport system component